VTIPISAIALFCEDIREEKAGTQTIIGITPDNLEIPASAGVLPRFSFFIRLNFDPDEKLSAGKIRITFPNGQVDEPITIEEEVFEKARKEAKEQGSPIAGIFSRVVAQNLPISLGRMLVEMVFPDRKLLLGTTNFILSQQPATS
jgi:hypothetical protein